MKFIKSSFSVSYMNSSHDVEGYKSELFGIHKVRKAGWKLTHLPSGLSVCSTHFKTKAQAQEYAVKFYNLLPQEQWASEHPFMTLDTATKDALWAVAKESARAAA